MKKVSFALLLSLFVAGSITAHAQSNGIVTTHDANVASQIEQHARDAQAQPPAVEHDAQVAHESAPHKTTHRHHHHHHHHYGKHSAKPQQASAGE